MKNNIENDYLIGMIPVEEFLRFGYEIGLNANSQVLDLCCGYGTVLKVWNENFGISGVGVDIEPEFLEKGKERLEQAGIDQVQLILGDVTTYQDDVRYDVVILGETIGSINETIALGKKFLKPGGVLAYHKLYSKVPNPPQELIDFDLEVLTLSELNHIFNDLGYYLIALAKDTPAKWDNYIISWNGKRLISQLQQNPNDADLKQWIDKWYGMYFDYRMPYEGQALFGLIRG